MQKIRLQIMLNLEDLNALHRFMVDHQCKNESVAISKVVLHYTRLQFIVGKLEEKAHEAEEWKKRAEEKAGIASKPITVVDAEVNTDSKPRSVGNIKNIQKQGGEC